jgi:DNA-binding CsgD family transcriptional regulator
MLGHRSEPGIAHEILAWECAGRGLHDATLPLLRRAREIVTMSGVDGTPPHLGRVLAHCALCRGDLPEVIAVLEDQVERHGGVDHTATPLAVAPVLVEAYLGLGRSRDADLLTRRFAELVPADAPPHALAKVERCRGLVAADADEACAAFNRALEHHAGDIDLFEGARTRLLLGMRLRRSGQRIVARTELRRARREFLDMEQTSWADRAAAELAGTGQRAVRGARDEQQQRIAPLTAQETRVALLAAEGRTNREIATELFLSAKTVEHHVGAVLRKRGLRSRTELARLVARDELDAS